MADLAAAAAQASNFPTYFPPIMEWGKGVVRAVLQSLTVSSTQTYGFLSGFITSLFGQGAEEKAQALEQELKTFREQRIAPTPTRDTAPTPAQPHSAPVAATPATPSSPQSQIEQYIGAEPNENDPAFEGDYGKYLRAVSAYAGKQAFVESRLQEVAYAQQQDQHRQQQEAMSSWAGRVQDAASRYPDFHAVALQQPVGIPEGSPIDAWVMEHKSGPDVLYYFAKHPQDLAAVLQMPVIEQVDTLALLSQRLAATTGRSAGATGAAPTRSTSFTPPRPPTPVRTEAQHVTDGPPEGHLSIAEHAKHFGRSR
jgi:hypothetical protein